MLRSGLLIAIIAGAGVWVAGLAGCDVALDSSGPEIGSAVQLLTTSRGELAEQALRRIEELSGTLGSNSGSGRARSRVALPYLEAALHRADPVGRRNLVIALRRLGLAESTPLLGHIAAFDSDSATAREAWQTLSLWATATATKTGHSERAAAASAALRKVDEVRGNSSFE